MQGSLGPEGGFVTSSPKDWIELLYFVMFYCFSCSKALYTDIGFFLMFLFFLFCKKQIELHEMNAIYKNYHCQCHIRMKQLHTGLEIISDIILQITLNTFLSSLVWKFHWAMKKIFWIFKFHILTFVKSIRSDYFEHFHHICSYFYERPKKKQNYR